MGGFRGRGGGLGDGGGAEERRRRRGGWGGDGGDGDGEGGLAAVAIAATAAAVGPGAGPVAEESEADDEAHHGEHSNHYKEDLGGLAHVAPHDSMPTLLPPPLLSLFFSEWIQYNRTPRIQD